MTIPHPQYRDHPVFREGLRTIIGSQNDMQLVGQSGEARDAIRAFRRCLPDVTLMDLRLPGSNGMDVLMTIPGDFLKARVIVLTTSEQNAAIQQALRACADAYDCKSAPQDELLTAIRSAHAGHRHVPPDFGNRLAEHYGDEALTEREMDVLHLIWDGCKNKEIATRLTISETTVSFCMKNPGGKLQASDRTHAVVKAFLRGILQP